MRHFQPDTERLSRIIAWANQCSFTVCRSCRHGGHLYGRCERKTTVGAQCRCDRGRGTTRIRIPTNVMKIPAGGYQ